MATYISTTDDASVAAAAESLLARASAARRQVEQHTFGPNKVWKVEATQGLMADSKHSEVLSEELGLPQLPEMVFVDNTVTVFFNEQPRISFNARDALSRVSLTPDQNLKVAATEKWREARKDSEYIDRETVKFDWTFTTEYFGTLLNVPESSIREVRDKKEAIDLAKLMRRDPIQFFQDMILFEDELSDNGCALLNVKLRVMKSCFLLLLRFYLRVDDVIVRVIDSRFYSEPDWNFLVWEFTKREDSIEKLKAEEIGYGEITKPDEISQKLSVIYQSTKVIDL